MLLQLQKDMLKNIAAKDMQHIVNVYKIALMHNDFDTADYIADNYFEKMSDEQHKEATEFAMACFAEFMQSSGNVTTH